MAFEIYPVSLFINWPMITKKKTVYEIIYFWKNIGFVYFVRVLSLLLFKQCNEGGIQCSAH